MNSEQPHLASQVPLLERLRSNCEQYEQIYRQVFQQLDQLQTARQEAIAQIDQNHAAAVESVAQQIEQQYTQRCEEIHAQAESQRAAAYSERQQHLTELQASFDAAQKSHLKSLESELWVMQSICDENGEDTPVTQYQKAKNVFQNHQKVSEETLGTLHARTADAMEFLERCHVGADNILPTTTLDPANAETNRQRISQEASDCLAASDQIFRYRLPSLIQGFRPMMIALIMTLVIGIPMTALKADLRAFVNPDLAKPDWAWFGISMLTGAGLAAVFTSIIFLVAQQKLRNSFQQMLQKHANVQFAATAWKNQTERQLLKLRKDAKKWQNQVNEVRERHTQALQGGADSQLGQLKAQLAYNTDIIDQHYNQTIAAINSRQSADRQTMDTWKSAETSRLHDHMTQELKKAFKTLQDDVDHQTETLNQHRDQVLHRWKHESSMVMTIAAGSEAAVQETSHWPVIADGDWTPPEHLPEALPAGTMQFALIPPPVSIAHKKSSPDNAAPVYAAPDNLAPDNAAPANPTSEDGTPAAETHPVDISLPAVLRFPTDTSIVVEHDASGREAALDFVRAILLKLLTTITPGRVQFTLIDPVGLGQSFSAMMHMADFDELIIGSRIWTESSQIRDRLQKVTEHMENVFQTYLRSEFQTIEQYNASAGEVAEPYHFVVVAGFPVGLSEEASRHLASIVTSGARCGVHAIITHDPSQSAPRSFDLKILKHECVRFQVLKGKVQPVTEDPTSISFHALQPPAAADYVSMVRAVGEKSRNARRVEVSFTRIAPKPDELWTHSSADGIDLPIGRAGAARLQYMRLGRGTSQHVMIAGKTGSGKSTLLHILITNLSLHYSPSEIQFFLIDFKKGVEFRTYAANQLPHARVIAIESDREFGLSVLERLDEVLQERGELFRARGVQDVPSFREQFPNEPMPRQLLLIDEFQEFFVAEDRVSSRASLLLDRLIRQGRAFGVHVILGSQTLGGAYSLARSTLGQVAVRIALQCSEGDAHLILSEENSAARLLTRPGEAIYNDANGMTEGNHPFQIAWLNERRREQAITEMLTYQRKGGDRSRRAVDNRMIIFEGNVAPSAELCGPLNAWLAAEADATRKVSEYLPFWVGEPVAIAPPTCIELRRASGQNLLIVGQDSDMADSILLMSALACFHPPARPSQANLTSKTPKASESDNHQSPQFILLHDNRDRDAVDRFRQMIAVTASPVYSTKTAADTDDLISDLHANLLQREASIAQGEQPEIICAIRNLGQFRTLRKDDDEYGFGGFGEPKTATSASMLTDLIKRGPLVGIHFVIWADTYSNATRWLANSMLREFEYRIAFRLNQTDSASLLDTPVAAALSPGRAILYRDQTGAADKFRPFAWPTTEWLSKAIPQHEKSEALLEDFDINSITIE